MKRIIAVLSCLIIMVLCIPKVSAAEKYLTSEGQSSEIIISENGNAHIKEQRSYYFGGDTITRCQRRYKLNDYKLTNFCVYFDDQKMNILKNPDEGRPEGCAAVYNQNGKCCVDVYMKCLNESHTFTIEYDVMDAVVLHDDSAEFRWNISSADEPTDTSDISAKIIYPSSLIEKATVNTVGFSNNYTQNEKSDTTSELVLHQSNLSKNQAASVQLLMSKELFPQTKRYEKEIGSLSHSDETYGYLTLDLLPCVLLPVLFLHFFATTIISVVFY